MINPNARFPTHLTRLLLPVLKSARPALILNIGILPGAALPYLLPYVSTKGYMSTFSQALVTEFLAEQCHEVDVLYTQFSSVHNSNHRQPMPVSFCTPAADAAVDGALSQVRIAKMLGRGGMVPWLGHALQALPVKLMGEGLVRNFVANHLKRLRDEEQRLNQRGQ